MGGNLSKATQLIAKSTDDLLNSIKRLSENGPYRSHRKISSTFGLPRHQFGKIFLKIIF